MHLSGCKASHGLDAVNIGTQGGVGTPTHNHEAGKQKSEKLPLFKPREGLESQLTKIAVQKKIFFEKQIHHQTVSPAPFISTSVVLIERLTAGSREINVFSLTREWLNDSQMQK